MVRVRTWNLRLNVDQFNRSFAQLEGTEEQSAFLCGMWRAMNGSTLRLEASEAMASGFEFAQQMLDEAEAYRARAAESGSIGGTQRAINAGQGTLKAPLTDPEGTLKQSFKPPFKGPSSQNQPNLQSFKEGQPLPLPAPLAPPSPKGELVQVQRLPRKGKSTSTPSRGEDFDLFLELVWKPYPPRIDQKTGDKMGKGKQALAYERAREWVKREGGTWQDLGLIVAAYHNHPNVKKGFVQLVEVFLGKEGHWMECATRIQRNGELRPALDRLRDRGLPTLPPGTGDPGAETSPVLEASGSDRG